MCFQTINALHEIHNPCEGVGRVRNSHTAIKTQTHTQSWVMDIYFRLGIACVHVIG